MPDKVNKLFKSCLIAYIYSMRILLLMTFILFLSCRKEDDILPNITWLQPASNQSYQFGDNIIVSGSVSDDRIVEWVEISILNPLLTPVDIRRINYNSSDVEFYANILLDNVQSESGSYYLKVRVSDGANITSEHRPFNYVGAPKEFVDLLVCKVSGGQTEIQRISDLSSINNYSYPVENFSVNSWEQDLLTYGHSGPIECYDLYESQLNWSKTSSNWTDTLVLSQLSQNSSTVVTHLDGWFTINSAGTSFGGNYYGSSVQLDNSLLASDYVFLEHIMISNGQHTLVKCSRNSGVTLDVETITGEIVSLSELSNGDILVVVQNVMDIEILRYNSLSAGLQSLRIISGEDFLSSTQLGDNQLFISTNNGLFSYTISSNSWVNMNSNSYIDLAYNEVDIELYGLQATGVVNRIDNLGTVLSATSISDAKAIEIWYNK